MSGVAAGEIGVLRVFAIDLPGGKAEKFVAVERASGVATRFNHALSPSVTLDPAFVEIVCVADLRRQGHSDLLAYVTDAQFRPADLAHNAKALRAAAGQLVLVWSEAFGGAAVALHPAPPVRLLATLRMTAPAPRPRGQTKARALPVDPRQRRNMITGLALAGVVALALALALVYLGVPG